MIYSTAGKYYSKFANKKESRTMGTREFFFFACDLELRRPKAEDTSGGSLSFKLQLTDTGNHA